MSEYKWNFPICRDADINEGVKRPLEEFFKGQTKTETLVRESIQNSLDAVLDESKPVIVEFEFGTLNVQTEPFRDFLNLKKHIQGCINFYYNSNDAKVIYGKQLEFIRKHPYLIPYMRVSDYNTKGMVYTNKDDSNCSFFGFLRSRGAGVYTGAGGGAFGFGKMAYFSFSELSTIFVSTYNYKEQYVFEGSSMLCTNRPDEDMSSQKYMATGFFDNNNGLPVTNKDEIPELFLRDQEKGYGSDIYSIGVYNDPTSRDIVYLETMKYVLINFWTAIYFKKLEVIVNGTKLSKDNLDEKMHRFFKEETDNDTSYTNPLPYYLAVKGAEEGDEDCHVFGIDATEDSELPAHNSLGNIRFYIKKVKNQRDRFLRMRKPLMVIDNVKKNSQYHYCGVLICDGERGNELLRQTEPPAHDAWDEKRLNSNPDAFKSARKALKTLESYTAKCIELFFSGDRIDVTEIDGLPDLLKSIDPSTLSDMGKAEDSDNGEGKNEQDESQKGEMTTSLIEKAKEVIKKKEEQNVGEISEDVDDGKTTSLDESEIDEEERRYGGNGEQHTKVPNPNPAPSPNHTNQVMTSGGDKKAQKLLKVTYRVFAVNREGKTVYKLKFSANKDTEKGRISVFVANADGSLNKKGKTNDNRLPLIWASKGEIYDTNGIKDIHINRGENCVEFMFDNNNKYAISIAIKEDL